jgi:hypothetical protein
LQDTKLQWQDTKLQWQDTKLQWQDTKLQWQDTKLKWQDTKLQWQDTKLQWQPGRSPNCARIFAMLMKVRAPQSAAVEVTKLHILHPCHAALPNSLAEILQS